MMMTLRMTRITTTSARGYLASTAPPSLLGMCCTAVQWCTDCTGELYTTDDDRRALENTVHTATLGILQPFLLCSILRV